MCQSCQVCQAGCNAAIAQNHTYCLVTTPCSAAIGDPLGPLCFTITLQPIVETIKREVPNLLCSAWYLDDGTLCGTPQDLSIALRIIEEEGLPRELCLNHHKSLSHISLGNDICNKTLPSDIPITSSGFCLLGSPIGSDCSYVVSILDRIAKIWRALG